jgi:tetratricopeptide (TPR) repeat protein
MARRTPLALAAALLISACNKAPAPPSASPAPLAEASVPHYQGLGDHTRKVTTANTEAQKYFDQGMSFLFAFNHDEAIRSFKRAAELDPSCAMAHWAIALANGPHINYPLVPPEHAKAAWDALAQAQAHAAKGTDTERALIEALAARYANPQPEDRSPLDAAYADAMRKVWAAHPDDADVGALFAESMMDLRPWNLWTHDKKAEPGTEEIIATLEAALKTDPSHPLANHLYIHALEMSPTPELAVEEADRLRTLQPAMGHNVHMPSHIDVLLGKWARAAAQNEAAIAADTEFRKLAPKKQGFYRVYMAHNQHMLTFAAMMQGRKERSLSAIKQLVADMPEDWVKENALMVDGFIGAPYEVMLRFGAWDDVLAAPEAPEYLPLTRALRHYARGVALAAQGKAKEAREEQAAFVEGKAKIPADSMVSNNTSMAIAELAGSVLEGEISFREGKIEAGLKSLRDGVVREDALHYDEPPGWIQPVRHALGAALLQAGKFKEAEAVYREDLKIRPENGWSLYGLSRALKARKKNDEAAAVEARFNEAWKDADIELSSSCLCLPGV